VAVNSFFAGTLEGVRQTYLQTVLDGHSRHAWARFYTSKLPLTAVQILNNHVLPFVEKHRAKIATVLSDNGREFCGRPDRHPLRASPPARGDRAPHDLGPVPAEQRIHRALTPRPARGAPRIQGRTKRYEAVEEMQADLDWLPGAPQYEAAPPGPRHGWPNAVSGVQGGAAEEDEEEGRNHSTEGGEGSSLEIRSGGGVYQPITVPIHLCDLQPHPYTLNRRSGAEGCESELHPSFPCELSAPSDPPWVRR